MTILIADSSVHIIYRLESLILDADRKLQIYKAVTFEEASRLLYEFEPEVILLDMHLPANRSFDLIKQIKAAGCNTCIVALSNHGLSNIREHCKKSGADYCLDKYKEFDLIPDIIHSIANKKE